MRPGENYGGSAECIQKGCLAFIQDSTLVMITDFVSNIIEDEFLLLLHKAFFTVY